MGLNKPDSIWLGASPHSPQRKQLFNLLGDVPQVLLTLASIGSDHTASIGSGHTIPHHTIRWFSRRDDDTNTDGVYGFIRASYRGN